MSESSAVALLESLAPGLGPDGPLNAQYLYFSPECIWSSNGEVGCAANYPEELKELKGIGAVVGEKLIRFLAKRPANANLRLTRKNDHQLQIQAGSAKVVLPTTEPTKNAPIPPTEGWIAIPEGFKEAVASASHCCFTHIHRPLLTCVHVKKEYIEASDAFRAIRWQVSFDKKIDVLLPRNAAQLIAKNKVTHVCPRENDAWYKTGQGVMLWHRVMSGEYPDLSSHIAPPKEGGYEFTLPPLKELIPVIDRACIFGTEADNHGLEEGFANITISKGRIKVITEDNEGRFEETIRYKGEAPDISFSMNIRNLLDLADQGLSTKCVWKDNRLWMIGKKWEYVAAVRVPEAEKET